MTARILIVLAIAAVLCGAPSSASAAGPNNLSLPQASPPSGTTATTFSFTVTYAGGFPALSVMVDVAGRALPMTLINGTPTEGTWSVATQLEAGTWSPTFRAVASQGKSPSITGPSVTVGTPATPTPATPKPTITAPSPRSAQPDASNGGGAGSGSGFTPPPAAPMSTVPPAAPGGPGEKAAPPGPIGSAPVAPAQAASTAEASDTDASDAATVSAAPETGGPNGVGGSGQSAASASRAPSSTPAADTAASIPTDSQIGPLELVLSLGGLTALALFAGFVLLASRRRRAAPEPGPSGADVRIAGATAEEQVTATLHRRTLRRSRMRLDEDPIVAALGVGAPNAGPAAHPARRATRRSPPT